MLRKLVLLMFAGGLIAAAGSAADDKKSIVVTIDKVSSRTPADWEEVKTTKPFRFKEFKVPKAGDAGDAELVIFEGVGGSFDDNLKRWKNMFKAPEGKTIDDVTKVEKSKVGEIPIVYVEINGTYLYKPNPAAEKAEPRPEHRMLMVLFDSPNGPYFIRLIGPDKTVTQHKKGFDEWLKNFK